MARAQDIKTSLVRASFIQGLFELQTTQRGGKQWQVTLLLPKTDTAMVKQLEANFVDACVAANWGDEAKVRDMIAKGLIKPPVLDGDGKQGLNKKTGERHPGYEGHWFIRCTSGEAYRPQVVDEQVQPIASFDPTRFKSGDYGYAVISAFTWDSAEQGKGVTFGISAFQKIRNGDPLGGAGGVDTDKFFKPETVQGEAAPDETKGGAGAGGLFG